ncbi:nuclear transport factor 2 family protein [Chryseobacterium aahli]|uniref:nuclear transport factor 2 family protein n=1 Tax=Chryseobacterium TaxID=59732 RepID=UPI000F0C5874|nr:MULTISPECIES: nuclear transport factor 2 family protein [Chryseobacterium]AYN01543.1 nuclear transport factor 2 family protein [Chryseobacterium sp. 3008163]MCI3938497.1 nuclear transport factor 2 family protein [Chryseobacterium aahli]
MNENEKIVTEFLKMMSERKSEDNFEKFYHQDAEQIEYPNLVTKNVAKRSLEDLKIGSERGRKIMSKEVYEIKKLYSFENIVILEAVWKGTISIPIGKLQIGEEMVAYFAQFFEIKDGKIFRQRNYDCFEPLD